MEKGEITLSFERLMQLLDTIRLESLSCQNEWITGHYK
jgi:hypothetical protein